jgi:hypothetical protein
MDLRKELETKLTTQSNKYSNAVKKIRELEAARKKLTVDSDIKNINIKIDSYKKDATDFMKEYNRLVKLRKNAKSYDSLSVKITQKEKDLAKAEQRGENVTALKIALTKARNDRSNLVPKLGNLVEPETKAELAAKYYTGRGTKENPFLQSGKPFTGTYNNRKYKDGIDLGLTKEQVDATKAGVDARKKKDEADAAAIAKAKADAASGTSGTGDATPTVTGPLTTPGKTTGIQGPGVGVRDALKIPGRAEPAFQELIDKAEFNFGLPDYIFTVDRDKKTGELGQLGKLLLEAVEKGFTKQQFLDRAMLTDWWQSNAGSVRERIIDLNKYKELQKKGLDVSKSDFGMYQTDKMRQVKARAKTLAGVTLDDATAQKIVEDIYNGFLDNDPLAIDRLIIPYVSKTTNLYGKGAVTGFGGEALQIQQSLASIAKANGLSVADILPKLGGGVIGKDAEQNTIQEILSGNIDLNTVLSNARQIAAQGQPEYVRKLLGSGYNLEDIYAPYKQTMANVLEINPDQIDLNDNSLRMAINEKGDMNIYDYKKALRQDSRWQYTGQAKESVSNAALKVLQDFGFQG